MTPQELAQLVFQTITENLDPADTAEFATEFKELAVNSLNSAVGEMIIDKLETVGIIITGIPCKRHPTI